MKPEAEVLAVVRWLVVFFIMVGSGAVTWLCLFRLTNMAIDPTNRRRLVLLSHLIAIAVILSFVFVSSKPSVLLECLCLVALRYFFVFQPNEGRAAATLIGTLIGFSFLVVDLVMSLIPNFYSVALPFELFSFSACLSLNLVLLIQCFRKNIHSSFVRLFQVSQIFFVYVAFMEFLVIWSGNMGREVIWYRARSQGIWSDVSTLLVISNAALPLVFILMPRSLWGRKLLTSIFSFFAVSAFVTLSWYLLPAFLGGAT